MKSSKIGLAQAISIGIGGMVGGGIFAVLGLAVSLGKGSTPISFFIAGVIALITSYSYVKMSKTYPDRGGTVKFINVAFGKGVTSGGVNNLLWLSYIIMLSLYASAFGSYAPNLLSVTDDLALDFKIYATGVVVLAAVINYYSVKVVSDIESIVVVIKLLILLSFVVVGLIGLPANPNKVQLGTSYFESPFLMITAGMVIFVAYEGFELIANSVPDLKAPQKNVSRAYYIAVIFVIILYIIIAIVTVGSLPFGEVQKAQDYVLAEAAKPMLGQGGFTIITIAALLSSFSAINASIYGGTQVNYEVAEDKELPHGFTKKLWSQPIGLLITVILTIILVTTVNLESISTAGSIGFLLVFGLVNLANYRKRKETKAKGYIALSGFILCMIALITLIVQQIQTSPLGVEIIGLIVLICFAGEWLYQRTVK